MPEPLVVHDAHENVRVHDRARHARVQGLRAVVGVTRGPQLLPEVVDGPRAGLVEGEGGGVLLRCGRKGGEGPVG